MNTFHMILAAFGIGAAVYAAHELKPVPPAPVPRYEFHTKGVETIRTDHQTGAVQYFLKGQEQAYVGTSSNPPTTKAD